MAFVDHINVTESVQVGLGELQPLPPVNMVCPQGHITPRAVYEHQELDVLKGTGKLTAIPFYPCLSCVVVYRFQECSSL